MDKVSDLEAVFSRHFLWPAVEKIIQKLESAGFLAYLAGGSVRDALLGKIPTDFDVATIARPDDIMALFPDSNKQGRAFGVVAVFCRTPGGSAKGQVEVATFRRDGPYKDGRHPSYVEFLSDKEDALRRDFTVNALFYHLKTKKIVDYVSGVQDIGGRMVRAVGDPARRFEEDRLRILRALRFAVQLDFDLEAKTRAAVFKMKDSLWSISMERIYAESVKMLQTAKFAAVMEALKNVGFLKKLFPALEEVYSADATAFWRRLKLPANRGWQRQNSFLWVCAFYPLWMNVRGKVMPAGGGGWVPAFSNALKRHKFPFAVIREMQEMFRGSCVLLDEGNIRLAKKLRVFRSGFIQQILFLSMHYADKGGVSRIAAVEKEFKKRQVKGVLPLPLVTGEDLKKQGVREDKNMGILLEKVYDYQLEQNVRDKKQLLESWKNGMD